MAANIYLSHNIIIVCQEAAANPLQSVFPSWPDGSKVGTKDPHGDKTYLNQRALQASDGLFRLQRALSCYSTLYVLLLLLLRLLLTAQGPPRGNIAATLLIIIINMIVFLSSINMACL